MSILILLIYLASPAVIQWAERRLPAIEKVGAVTLCYALGLVLANLPGVVVDLKMATQLIEIVVPLSIPLLLFSSDVAVWRRMGGSMVKAFGAAIVAVSCSVAIFTYFFRDAIDDVWIAGSMMMGVYTGGTPNMSAIGIALGVDSEVFVLLNAADLLFGGFWLLFLLGLGKRVFDKLLGRHQEVTGIQGVVPDERMDARGSILSLLLAVVILAIAIGISYLLFSSIDEVTILFVITTLGILASTRSKVRSLKGSFGLGNYLLLVFCVAVGSLANVQEIMVSGPTTIAFVGSIMFLSISLHFIFSKMLRLSSDAFIISSAAGIFGPAFIAPVARAIRNPTIIPLGIALSLLGFAIGNYCGILMSKLLILISG